MRERLRRLVDLAGPAVVFFIIMGSVYTGWATVTESAALAVIATLVITLQKRVSVIRFPQIATWASSLNR